MMAAMPKSCSQAGFTFIEIMVVIVILGVIAGSASQYLTFSPARYEVEKAADTIMLQLNQLRKEAILQALPYGAKVEKDAVLFFSYNEENQQWEEYRFFIDNELADIIQYDIDVQRSDIVRNSRRDPDIIFTGDSYYTPFELTVTDTDEAYLYVLTGNGLGAIIRQ